MMYATHLGAALTIIHITLPDLLIQIPCHRKRSLRQLDLDVPARPPCVLSLYRRAQYGMFQCSEPVSGRGPIIMIRVPDTSSLITRIVTRAAISQPSCCVIVVIKSGQQLETLVRAGLQLDSRPWTQDGVWSKRWCIDAMVNRCRVSRRDCSIFKVNPERHSK